MSFPRNLLHNATVVVWLALGAAATISAQIPQTPKPAPAGVRLVENLAYREGNPKWVLDLAMPEKTATSPRAALVIVHGGGWSGGDKTVDQFRDVLFAAAERGYVAVTINYRLKGEAKFPACIQDVRTAVRWLRANASKYQVDPSRIAAYGQSAGAHLAVLAGLVGDDWPLDPTPVGSPSARLQACIGAATPTNFDLPDLASQGQSLLPAPTAEWKRAASPTHHVTASSIPVCLIHGTADRIVPFAQAQSLYDTLRAAGGAAAANSELHPIEGAAHNLARADAGHAHWKQVHEIIFRFLAKHLGTPAVAPPSNR